MFLLNIETNLIKLSAVNKTLMRTLSVVEHYFIMFEFIPQILSNIRTACRIHLNLVLKTLLSTVRRFIIFHNILAIMFKSLLKIMLKLCCSVFQSGQFNHLKCGQNQSKPSLRNYLDQIKVHQNVYCIVLYLGS